MKRVRHLRQRIYRASWQGNHKQLRSLQRLMLRSRANRELSVRRVTEINKGRLTAGVDKLVVEEISQYQPWNPNGKLLSTHAHRIPPRTRLS